MNIANNINKTKKVRYQESVTYIEMPNGYLERIVRKIAHLPKMGLQSAVGLNHKQFHRAKRLRAAFSRLTKPKRQRVN